ncbi:DMT family transporter [Dactylosporangium darangshiense]|uniref:Integral membrane protein n=1 Tax=Dactylosporangium darangshiense TaxID=579108 RepID=A0ABP8DQH3_9ACTN
MLLVAIPCALAAACGYGAATAVEHAAASGREGRDLVRDRRWRLGMALDGVAALLQVVALSTGPVILVQPCLLLALPVSLLVAWRLGAHRPAAVQYRACGLIFAGVAAFFLLIGDPGDADPLRLRTSLATAATLLATAAVVLSAARRWGQRTRAAACGLIAGACTGLAAVLLDAVAASWQRLGRGALTDPDALVATALLVPAAAAGVVLLQLALRVDGLGVGYPADVIANPITAVVLGALLLHEEIPHSPRDAVGFVVCLGVIVAGTALLATHRPVRPAAAARAHSGAPPK